MRKLICIFLFIFSTSIFANNIKLTESQENELDEILKSENRDLSKYNFSDKDKNEYFTLFVYLFFEGGPDNPNTKLVKRYEELDRKYESAEKLYNKDAKNRVLLRFVKNNNIKQTKKVILAGPDVNYSDNHGNTPLIYAAYFGYTEMVKVLLDAKADPLYERRGSRAFNLAAEQGHKEILYVFLDDGINRFVIVDAMNKAISQKKETLTLMQESLSESYKQLAYMGVVKTISTFQAAIEKTEKSDSLPSPKEEIERIKNKIRIKMEKMTVKREEIKKLQKLYCNEPELNGDKVCTPIQLNR